MKTLIPTAQPVRIESRVGVTASSDALWDVLADLAHWDDWNPLHPKAVGTLAIGGPLDLTETVAGTVRHLKASIIDWVPRQQLVWADRREWLSSSVRYFEIEELEPGHSIFANGEIFHGWRGTAWARRNKAVLRDAYAGVGEAMRARVER